LSIQYEDRDVTDGEMAATTPALSVVRHENADRVEGFADLVVELVVEHDLDSYFDDSPVTAQALLQTGRKLAERAYVERDDVALRELHRALYVLYEDNLRPAGQSLVFNQFNPQIIALRNQLERA
jgi:hypothetical protein